MSRRPLNTDELNAFGKRVASIAEHGTIGATLKTITKRPAKRRTVLNAVELEELREGTLKQLATVQLHKERAARVLALTTASDRRINELEQKAVTAGDTAIVDQLRAQNNHTIAAARRDLEAAEDSKTRIWATLTRIARSTP